MTPIGLTIWGLHHQHPRWYWPLFQNLPEFKPLAVCDADAPFLARENEFFQVDAYADPAAMLGRQDVEAVLIFVPHRQMPAAVEQAVRAGKHVMVEKPMCADVAGARRVVAAAEVTRLKVTTGYYWRYAPTARRIKEWIDQGLLGRIVHLEGRMNAQGAWRYVRDNALWMLDAAQRGGPMFNLGVHWIDLFHWWTGLEVQAVTGAINSLGGDPPRTIEDNASALLEYGGGVIGQLDISYGVPASFPLGRDFFLFVRGTKGCVQWRPSLGGEEDQVLLVSDAEAMGPGKVRRAEEQRPHVPGYCGQMGLDALCDWARSIREDRPVGVPVTDGLRAAIVADAVLRSAAERRRMAL